MESHRSLFETELHKQLIPIHPSFMNGPIDFKESQSKQKLKVLEGGNPLSPVQDKRVAVLFSGGPAAGGHNVLLGIKQILGETNRLYGVQLGPAGLINGDLVEISDESLSQVINLGGFDFLGTSRTKIKTPEQFKRVRQTVRKFKLNGIIIIGGDDSNTNAALLADYLKKDGCHVIGVPKTIDGDLQVGNHLPISFGFDTATKIYAELVGNILQDTASSRKYWHFIKLMGRSASHVALEVALQTRPAVTLISEEVAQKNQSLQDIVDEIALTVLKRAAKGLYHGVVIVPEGLIEFIPEFKILVQELNDVVATYEKEVKKFDELSIKDRSILIEERLSKSAAHLMESLPLFFKEKLLLDRDAHGNLKVSQIDTEKLLLEMVGIAVKLFQTNPKKWLKELSSKEKESVISYKYETNHHFFGYEGRCGAPTKFDAAFTFNLGLIAGSLVLGNKTGYMAALSDLDKGGRPLAIPLSGLITMEKRHGHETAVIQKALVQIDSLAFQYFSSRRNEWAKSDCFTSPGPRQIWGPIMNQLPMTVALNQDYNNLTFNLGKETKVHDG